MLTQRKYWARKNGPGVTEKATQANGQEEISQVSPTRSPSRFVGVPRLPRWRNARFHRWGLRHGRTWREGVLSLEDRRCDETNQYHPAQQSPDENDWLPGDENVHTEPPGTKSASRLQLLYCEKNQTSLREIRKGLCLMENSQPYPLAASPLAQVLYDPHKGTSLNEVLAQKGRFPQRI